MRQIVRYIVLSIVVLGICTAAIIPPEKNLRLGKDLAGGVSLVYNVEIGPNDPPEMIDRMIEILKDRVNPQGLFEISFVRQGRDRIEIAMPLPSERVQNLRKAYEAELEKLNAYWLDPAALERALRQPGEQRIAALNALMDSAPRRAMLEPVVAAIQKDTDARAAYAAAEARVQAAGTPDAALQAEVDRLQDEAGAASEALDEARSKALASVATPEQLRIALELSSDGPRIRDAAAKTWLTMPSPREEAVKAIRARITGLPDADKTIDDIVTAHDNYIAERRGLDDPADLERLLQGAGVLQFRITVVPGASADELRLREELRERGPDGVQSSTTHWYPLNKLEGWYENIDSFKLLRDNPAAYMASAYGLVAEPYGGQIYVLLHDEPGLRLTQAEGDWKLINAFEQPDQLGRPAVAFRMNPVGAQLLGTLTEANTGRNMAIVLDDEVISAPSINSRISDSGIIQGKFSAAELQYLIKTMAAGSLSAKLSAKPISKNTLAPDLGKDNLEKGYKAAWIALAAIGVFMLFYYYTHGVIAMVALLANAIIVLGCMSLSRAAFTLPGIAGIILTFGTAVDSNVLIYERIREEMLAGNDFRTAVRTAFSKVLSTIIDANMTNLIVCFVLAYVGTQEIKGFGITLGIGVVATIFCALILTRLIYLILIDVMGVKHMGQLALTLPKLQQWLTPKIDWIGLRHVFFTFSGLLCLLGAYMIAFESNRLLDTEFRGGTAVTVQLKSETASDGTQQPMTMTRAEVANVLQGIAAEAEKGDMTAVENRVLAELEHADVVAVNPESDGVTSNTFKIKTALLQRNESNIAAATDAEILQKAIVNAFRDKIESRPAIAFDRSDAASLLEVPAYPIVEDALGANFGRPEVRDDVSQYRGGVVFLLDNLNPAPTERILHERLDTLRSDPEFANAALKRDYKLIVLSENPDKTVKSAAVIVSDRSVSFSFDESKWRSALVASEWEIIQRGLTVPSTLAGVESFSSEVAATFKATAIVSIALSLLLVTIYVWVRFGSLRYSIAAMVPLFHDVIATVGVIGVTKYLVDWFPGLQTIGVREFKIDLGMVAALLTIIGFSLNDTVVILDRIRELRGKLAVASRQVINDAVNQCMSRTFITAGSTFVSLIVLFLVGGEGVASFSYTMLMGTILGTYSTIAIAAPIVWQKRVPPATGSVVRTTPDNPVLPSAAAQT